LLGSYLRFPVAAVLAATGVILAAVYLLWAYERVFTGPLIHKENQKLIDLNKREILIAAPLVVLILFLGVYPKPALDRIEPAVNEVLQRIEQTTNYTVPHFGLPQDLANPGGGE
jgi:NADH-quinone oxidoreductase subunit M